MERIMKTIRDIMTKCLSNKNRKRAAAALAFVVVFITVYSMILPAITLEQQVAAGMPGLAADGQPAAGEQVLVCTLPEIEEHQHSDACYTEREVLTCGKEAGDEHTHTGDCYTKEKTLICDIPETHTHTIDCYERGPNNESPEKMGWVKYETDANGNRVLVGDPKHLICGKTELAAHQHNADCYQTLTVPEEGQGVSSGAETADGRMTDAGTEPINGPAADDGKDLAGGLVDGTGVDTEQINAAEAAETEQAEAAETDQAEAAAGNAAEAEVPATADDAAEADNPAAGDIAENRPNPSNWYQLVEEEVPAADGNAADRVVQEGRIEKTVEVAGASYQLQVEYGPESNIPEDAQFAAAAITENDRSYDSYRENAVNAVDEKLNGETQAAQDLLGLFDLTIYDGDEKPVQPEAPIHVAVDFGEEIDEKNQEIYAVHLQDIQGGDSKKAASESAGQAAPEVIDTDYTGGAAESVSFEADGLPVYAIVGTTIEKNVLASDGHNYKVTAIYGADTGIPAGADLMVEEIAQGSEAYEAYVSNTENVLGMEEGSAGYIRLFDISIVDKDDHSIKYQPKKGTAVDVSIELADSESNQLSVVHFADESYEGTVVNAETDGQTVRFAADGFSVYSVISRETATGDTALDGKSYALTTLNNAALMGEALPSDSGKLAGITVNPTVGGTVQVNGRITLWTFEAVEGRPGWYYISDGHGNYLNITSTAGDGGTVTLGEKQAIYVATRQANGSTVYQLRNGETQNGSKAVNNYGNKVNNGFGAWTSSNANNDWFRLYDMEFLGDISVSFNANGGTGASPAPIWGLAGDSITLPDYTGTRNGYTFLGWSTGNNIANNTYYPVYPAGSAFTIPDKNTTLYAVWTTNNPVQGQFFIRLDGTIPYEPDQYDSSAYTSAINITGAIKKQMWVTDNDVNKPNNGLYVENNVTAELNQVPDAAQLVSNINGSNTKLGFKVRNENGEIVVSEITNAATNANNYNVSVGDKLYVLWYVQKYAGGWHVDGTLLVKDKVNISYDGNAPDGSVKNVPLGYQEAVGTEVTIGASGSKNGQVKTPTRPGYIFLGWNLKPDGSGTEYNNNDIYTLNEDTTLYAQWSKGKNMMTVAKTNDDGETLAGAQFKLEEKTASGAYIEKANRTTGESGTFTYDQMENDTLYRMTETYAPNGYEIQNAFFFKVSVDGSGSDTLQLHVCDENGHFIDPPNWLTITYIPAEDPRAQGVARIRFNIKDERIKRSITFIKEDENGKKLAGAEYTLTNVKGAVAGVLKEASDENGVFSVENAVLPYGSYTLTEDKAPVTYAIGDPVTFTLNDYVSESNTGLNITGGDATAECEVSSVTEQGLITTTYAYTVTVKDKQQAHIIVTKDVEVDGDLDPNALNTTVYYALTKKGSDGDYVRKANGEIWIEQLEIVNGVPTPAQVVFDGVDFGEYDVWEMALINGEYTRMYSGLVVGNNFQLDSVSAFSADGGNNANVSAEDLEAKVDFTNHYGKITQSTSFIANKKWTDRAGNEIAPPEGAKIEFTLYSEKKDAAGQIIENTLEKVRSIELDGVHDPDGEDEPWRAVFKYLPIYYEGNLEYSYKVKETVSVDGYYPNDYPAEYYLTSSGGTITNRKLLTDVELHKHFEIYPEKPELLNTIGAQLTFTVQGPGEGADKYQQTVTLNDFTASETDPYDYVLTLKDLPLGEYTVTEEGQEGLFSEQGYNLVYSVSTATGETEVGGLEQPVLKLELENSYAKRGTLVVKKNSVIHEAVDETTVPAEISGKEFAFVVRRGALYLQEDGSLGKTPYQFSLREGEFREFANVPAGRYTVIEQNASVEGYLWEVVDGTRNADGTYSKEITISAGESGSTEGSDADGTIAGSAGEASFDNCYTKIENGSLEISKIVTGGPAEAASKAYPVEITTTRHGETVWLDANGNLQNEKTVLTISQGNQLTFPTIPTGTYTVAEDEAAAAFDDYSLDVKYSTDQTFTIHKDGHASLNITNTYNYLYTPVKITKTVTGNMGNKNLYFGFDVYVRDADDQPVVIDGVTDANGLLQFSIKHGEERLLEKLPKGARLRIVEHNVHYKTTVNGRIGVGEDETETPLNAEETHHDLDTDTTDVYTFIIPEEGATIDFINDHTVEQSVVLKKTGYDNRDERIWDLPGATFKIYQDAGKTRPVELDGKTEFTSGEDGVFYSGKLGVGTYYLDETTVPDGYHVPQGMFILRVNENGVTITSAAITGQANLNDWITTETIESGSESDGSDTGTEGNVPTAAEKIYTVSIRNTAGYELPSTGGMGTHFFYLAGIAMILLAGVIYRKGARSQN